MPSLGDGGPFPMIPRSQNMDLFAYLFEKDLTLIAGKSLDVPVTFSSQKSA